MHALRQTRGLASYSLHGRMGNGGRGYWDRSSQTNFSGTGCPRLVVTVKLLPASVRHWGRRLRNRDFSPVSGLCGLNMGIMSNKHYRLADKRPLTTEESTLTRLAGCSWAPKRSSVRGPIRPRHRSEPLHLWLSDDR